MLYNEKKSTTAPTVMLQGLCLTNPLSVYSMYRKESIYSLKIEKIRHWKGKSIDCAISLCFLGK